MKKLNILILLLCKYRHNFLPLYLYLSVDYRVYSSKTNISALNFGNGIYNILDTVLLLLLFVAEFIELSTFFLIDFL